MIAFIGNVFSPWYKWARRNGGGDPFNHCAMNVALYGRGGKRWSMTERNAGALSRSADELHIGRSGLHWDGSVLTANIAEITAPLPSRLNGKIRLFPSSLATREMALDGIGLHRWSPIAPCARVEVEMQQPALRWKGTAYLDTNAGDAPLEEGFVGWDWSRAKLQGGTAILYHGARRGGETFCFALRYDDAGSVQEFTPPPEHALPGGLWRLPRTTRSDCAVQLVQRLEDAPFYARSVIASQVLGEHVTSVHESVSLDRFVHPLVQMMLPFKAPRRF